MCGVQALEQHVARLKSPAFIRLNSSLVSGIRDSGITGINRHAHGVHSRMELNIALNAHILFKYKKCTECTYNSNALSRAVQSSAASPAAKRPSGVGKLLFLVQARNSTVLDYS